MPDKDMDIPAQAPVQTATFGKRAKNMPSSRVPADDQSTRYLKDDDGNKLQGQDDEDMDILELQDEADFDDEKLMASGKTFEDETLWSSDLEMEDDQKAGKVPTGKSKIRNH